jgi:molybdate transport system substrate-binding protein
MNLRRPIRAAAAATLVTLLAGIAVPASARAAELLVGAASSLMHAMEQIGREFEAANPGTRVRFNFAVSDALLTQIADGAPIDVFVPDDDEVMDRAAAVTLAGTRRDVAANRLVLIVAPATAASAPPLASLADLATARIERVAICSPQNGSLGRYAKGALERQNLWTTLTPKFVFVADARDVRDRVVGGEAGAGFVYATDAALVGDRVKVAFSVPTATPIRYSAAVLRASTEEGAARAFVQYLRSAPARQVLALFSFVGL